MDCLPSEMPLEILSISLLPLVLFLPYLVSLLLKLLQSDPLIRETIVILVSLVALIIVRLLPSTMPIIVIIWFFLVMIITIQGKRHNFCLKGFYLFTIMFFIVEIGLIMRWVALLTKIGGILDPDAEHFYQLALHTTSFFTALSPEPPFAREPFLVWVTKIWFWFLPASRMSLRVLTVFFSLATIVAMFYFSRRVYRVLVNHGIADILATATALLMSVNPQFIFMSNRGLRFEIYLLLMLLFFISTFKPVTTFRSGVLIPGIIAGLLCLTRINTPAWLIPVVVVLAVKYSWDWWKPLAIIGIMIVLLLPHIFANYRYAPEHDPFFTANIHARFYRNLEFQNKPGFPSSADIRDNAWTGGPITFSGYLFALHSWKQLMMGSLAGLKRLFLTTHPHLSLFNSTLFVLGYLSGLLYLVYRRQWHLPVIMFLLVAPLVYLAGIGIDWRLVGIISPFLILFVVANVIMLLDVSCRRIPSIPVSCSCPESSVSFSAANERE